MATQATIISVADAVAAFLNALQTPIAPAVNPFAPFTFTAVRDYAPVFELKDMGVLHVVICPRNLSIIKPGGRGVTQPDVGIDVGILIKPATYDQTSPAITLDPLMLLVEQIAVALSFNDFGGASWIATDNTPVYAAEHLRDLKQFTSVLHLTLREGMH